MSRVHPVEVDGALFPGMPVRRIRLDEMRDWLLDPQCSTATRDAVWAHLVRRSRTEGPVFTAACVGLALPTLSRLARRLSARFVDDPSDIHAAVLTGFVTTLAVVDLHAPDILLRLRWAAYCAGHAAVREALDAPAPTEDSFGAAEARSPSGHPDVVLVRAVADGVITPCEAEIISATRLGELSVAQAAHARGVVYKTLHQARRRAEARLAVYLAGQPPSQSPRRRSSADPTQASLSVGNSGGRSRAPSQAGVSKTSPLPGVPPCEKPSPADPAAAVVGSSSWERF